MKIYQYPNCSTCRKATKWLEAAGKTFSSVHIVNEAPDVAALRDMWDRSGLELKRFFNTSGQSYRGGGFKDKLPGMTDAEAHAALAADGMLIKRPLLVVDDRIVKVGFREPEWRAALGLEAT